jgi:hypothetical protein
MTGGSLLRSSCCRRVAVIALGLLPFAAHAQFGRGRGRFLDDLNSQDYQWAVDPAFAEDAFTFARLKHQVGGGFGAAGGFGGYRPRMGWQEDYPRADVILPFRLHQITSLNVRPGPNPIEFTKEELAQYPFVYFSGVERMAFVADEVPVLRNYLLSGGFMLVENFWGDAAWRNFANQLKRVFPEREPVELALDHPIFHSVYDFKSKPQVPTAGVYENFGIFYDPGRDYAGMGHDPHYFALYDDKGRMMMLICHNNHFADGWEHEGDDPDYFHVISEGMAYPMFINIVTYAMTH